ncbi:Retrovirus-related Pol polyprotein from type-2 retrotransposable element R2DM [Thelohanellus kitauei]|uniref:Retrovirus-related Pol polyprotein from type-2 retrotransposable element R2DM n=1 Tax=Thelohanellus kitauei TaxID=669202 RepID=A0A0C2MSZ5_THEKT|nr:Retrovirus-related Pol polyprotein from type-2 retrotransposable element R2DM [Thelohanellus kitauei]
MKWLCEFDSIPITGLLNIFLDSKTITACLKEAKTILIPKTKARRPKDISTFRPIYITSLYRLYTGLLADRLINIASTALNSAQRGFFRTDGCLLNSLELLDIARAASRATSGEACLLFLDFEKAFDRIRYRYLLITCATRFGSKFANIVLDLLTDP